MNFNPSNFFNEAALDGLGLMVVLLWCGHWFPWFRLISGGLPKLAAYAYGSICIWAGFSRWWYGDSSPDAPVMLAVVIVVAGLAVFVAYGVDKALCWLDTNRRRGRVA